MVSEAAFYLLRDFFERPVCQEAAQSLHEGAQMAIQLVDGSTYSLKKQNGTLSLNSSAPENPDITFLLGADIPRLLSELSSNETGEIGISILSWMLNNDPGKKMQAKVHVGTLSLFKHGYFGVLSRGGLPVMEYLSRRGFGSLSKIKEALGKIRN